MSDVRSRLRSRGDETYNMLYMLLFLRPQHFRACNFAEVLVLDYSVLAVNVCDLIPDMLAIKSHMFRPVPVDGAKTPTIITYITITANRRQTAEWQFVALC